MKIAVYTIAKDEAKHVARWAQSCADADFRYILDTGSSDDTVALARAEGVSVGHTVVAPWRFDAARNQALAALPDDIDLCIALDMDEVLVPGWREHLEVLPADVTRPRYRYTWSWERPGKRGLEYAGDKIHARHGYVWRHPVHEVLTPMQEYMEVQGWCEVEIHHHPDHAKPRSQYLPLLRQAVEEDPTDDRNAHYYARELFFAGEMSAAYREFCRHLGLPTAVWGAERSQSCRYLWKITGNPGWLEHAIAEAPHRREPLMDAAVAAYEQGKWSECLTLCKAALGIKVKPLEYLTEAEAYGPLLDDLAAIACYRLGYHHEALYHGMQALRLDPYDQRLVDNLRYYEEAAA